MLPFNIEFYFSDNTSKNFDIESLYEVHDSLRIELHVHGHHLFYENQIVTSIELVTDFGFFYRDEFSISRNFIGLEPDKISKALEELELAISHVRKFPRTWKIKTNFCIYEIHHSILERDAQPRSRRRKRRRKGELDETENEYRYLSVDNGGGKVIFTTESVTDYGDVFNQYYPVPDWLFDKLECAYEQGGSDAAWEVYHAEITLKAVNE